MQLSKFQDEQSILAFMVEAAYYLEAAGEDIKTQQDLNKYMKIWLNSNRKYT